MAARTRAAGREFTDWVKHAVRHRGQAGASLIGPEWSRRSKRPLRDARESGTVAVGDISNSLAAVGRWRGRTRGVVFHELLGFKERDGALDRERRASMRAAAARRRRSHLARAACAVLDVARAVSGDSRGRERLGLPDHERAPRRVARGGRVARDGHRRLARHARGDRRLARRLAGAGLRPGGVSRRPRRASTRGRWSFTASSSTMRRWLGWRRSAPRL